MHIRAGTQEHLKVFCSSFAVTFFRMPVDRALCHYPHMPLIVNVIIYTHWVIGLFPKSGTKKIKSRSKRPNISQSDSGRNDPAETTEDRNDPDSDFRLKDLDFIFKWEQKSTKSTWLTGSNSCINALTLFSMMFSAMHRDAFRDCDAVFPIRYRSDGKLFYLRS